MSRAVFYDPERRRWKRIRAVFDLVGVAITIVLVVFIFSVMRGDTLPNLLLSEQRPAYRALKEKPGKHPKRRATHKVASPAKGADEPSAGGLRAAYYVSWDAGSFSSLKQYQQQIDVLFPEWLHVLQPDGEMVTVDSDNHLFKVVEDGQVTQPDPRVMEFLNAENSSTDVMPLVNNYDPVNKIWLNSVGDFLSDPEARRNFRQQVITFLESGKYAGLCVDFEEIPTRTQPGFRALIAELGQDLHAHNLKLYVTVPVDDDDFDYSALAKSSDGLVFMDYDQHQNETLPGPVASQDWFTDNLRKALKDVPREKIICAIGNYGYQWATQVKGRKRKIVDAHSISVEEAWISAAESDADVELDEDGLNPHIAFEDNSLRYDVWFLDAVTAWNQMRAAKRLGIENFALWRLGSEDRSIWSIWDSPGEGESTVAGKLAEVPPGYDVDMEGSGEVFRIEQKPASGQRTVTIDANSGLIDGETFVSMPRPYQIWQYGAAKNKVAITFDDGPDPANTPGILDVLKREHAPATFFLIGGQAEKYSSLTRRIYEEGHEIGNHTYTHPDISNIGRRYMDLELNLTERFFGSTLGVKTVYFRPPYSIDQEPDTADQVRPLEMTQDRGYIAVGDKIDPKDWEPGRTTSEIVESVEEQLGHGNIILLHDGGGDRSATVRALPLIIQAVRSRGYEIVPVSELLGKTRAQVMPPISANERFTARVDSVAFMLWGLLNAIIVLTFFVGDILMTGRLFFIGVAAVLNRALTRGHQRWKGNGKPRVAVIIPAFNEEKVIERTVRSVLASDYPDLRVIVVDDGSTDTTFEVARTAFAQEIAEGRLLLLSQPNSGKASASNHALRYVEEEIFLAIDADTVIAPDAVSWLVPHFSDPRIGAVAGNAKVGNRVNIWTRWQALEYITSQNFERRALDLFGAVSVVPGAIGAWRTAAVREVGFYPYDTVAEDADLTMSLLQQGYEVRYEDRALAYTEAPISAGGLMRQRFRWSFGILQAVWKHRRAFRRGGSFALLALPNIIIFQIILPLLSPFIDLMFAVGAIRYLIDRHYHPLTADAASFEKLVIFFTIFLLIDFTASAIAFLLEPPPCRSPLDKWLLSQVWLQRFAYRQLFSIVLFKTLKRAVDGRPFSWDKLERTASLSHVAAPSPDQARV
jgi:cellulose synthase/poly-beta-1,6-N-acetylglucosamine synthase-like glycosyltransferase/peptidoglycan/xylan/chitin deacetylase (PgdA/CDA1 family)/spore germination protein YaaH